MRVVAARQPQAELYSEAGGALCIEAVMEKSGQSGNEGDVEQYDDGHTGATSGHGGGPTVS